MKKKIKVIFKNHPLKQEQESKIINVSRGYAFNYLIPHGIAEVATKNRIKHYTMFSEIKRRQKEAVSIVNKKTQNRIDKISKITVYKKIGSNQLIFGSIKEKDIIYWINKHTNLSIDKKQIEIKNINKVSINYINIEFQRGIINKVKLCIVPYGI